MSKLFIRIRKETFIEVPEGMTYEQALAHGVDTDSTGAPEYELFVDVTDSEGNVQNEAGWDNQL